MRYDIGGQPVELVWSPYVQRPNDTYGYGWHVLRSDGLVVGIPERIDGYTITTSRDALRRVEGLPRIAHLRREFYEDFAGRIWYTGIWPLDRNPAIFSDAVSLTLTHCLGDPDNYKKPRGTDPRWCVAPTEIPILAGSKPTVSDYGRTLALYPDGKLRCWPTPKHGCPRGE